MTKKSNAVKTPEEIAILKEGGKILSKVLKQVEASVRTGISTWELDQIAYQGITRAGGKPSFLGYGGSFSENDNPFPASLCTSVNDEIVHGIPSKEVILHEGDIIGLDIGMEYKGLFTDTAVTIPVGKVNPKIEKLLKFTKQGLHDGIKAAKPGNRMGDIGAAIQAVAQKNGFGIIRDLVGHGVGYAVHEDPYVPNYGKPGTGLILEEGMVLALEPMFTLGGYRIRFDADGWTIRTQDGSIAAHFEHTIVVTKYGSEIIT